MSGRGTGPSGRQPTGGRWESLGRSGGRRTTRGGGRNHPGRGGPTNHSFAGRSRSNGQQKPTIQLSNTSHSERPINNNRQFASILQNGDKGAEVFVVAETTRIQFTQQLLHFREDSTATRLELPSSLTNTERKFLHQLAGQLGLNSKSTGKGDTRRIAVTKQQQANNNAHSSKRSAALPILEIGQAGIQAIRAHLQHYPPTLIEELESRETGASLVEAASHCDPKALAATLDKLGLGNSSNKEQRTKQNVRKTHADIRARQNYHQQAQTIKLNHGNYKHMMLHRKTLPAYSHQASIVNTVAHSPVTIVQGETGCGKSTQVPQFLLDANPHANIVVTQRTFISN
jgi:hypothetical protein